MKKLTIYAVFCLCLFMAVSCNNPEPEPKSNAQVINTPQVKEDSSEQPARKLTELYDGKNCKEFFDAFPNTFEELNQLYGYDDEIGARRLFSKSEHIPYFFNCSGVSDREKLEKVIRIGINGKWDADSIGWFQDLAYDLIKDHPKEAKGILDNLPIEQAASFWFFLFDGPHPGDKQNVRNFELLQFTLGKESKQSKLLSEQFQKLLILQKEDKASGVIGH